MGYTQTAAKPQAKLGSLTLRDLFWYSASRSVSQAKLGSLTLRDPRPPRSRRALPTSEARIAHPPRPPGPSACPRSASTSEARIAHPPRLSVAVSGVQSRPQAKLGSLTLRDGVDVTRRGLVLHKRSSDRSPSETHSTTWRLAKIVATTSEARIAHPPRRSFLAWAGVLLHKRCSDRSPSETTRRPRAPDPQPQAKLGSLTLRDKWEPCAHACGPTSEARIAHPPRPRQVWNAATSEARIAHPPRRDRRASRRSCPPQAKLGSLTLRDNDARLMSRRRDHKRSSDRSPSETYTAATAGSRRGHKRSSDRSPSETSLATRAAWSPSHKRSSDRSPSETTASVECGASAPQAKLGSLTLRDRVHARARAAGDPHKRSSDRSPSETP